MTVKMNITKKLELKHAFPDQKSENFLKPPSLADAKWRDTVYGEWPKLICYSQFINTFSQL